MKSPVRKARLTRRKKLIPWTAFGIAAPLLYLALVLIRGLSPILISSETTFVTEPIHSSGYVDLTEEINKCLRHNVAPNVTLKPKAILDALNRLETAVGPVDLRLDATAVTWTPDLQVEIDNVLEQIARQEGVIQCPLPPAGGPVKYMAIESKPADDLSSALLPLRRTLTSLLLRRLRESIEAGDSAEAIRDIQSLNDVVRFLLRQKTVLALHVAFSIQQETTDQMANAMAMESLRPEQVRALVPHVPQLEASELQAVARTQRLHALSLIFLTHSGMDATGARPVGLTRPWVERTVNAVRERWMLANADWNAVCRQNNEFFDVAERTVIATDQSIHDQSVAEANALSSLHSDDDTSQTQTLVRLGVRPGASVWLELLSKSRSAARRLDLLSIAGELFQHRSEATEFPVSLTDLKSLPKHDDGRAGPIVYRRVKSGFELMSGIEPNLTKLSYDGKQSLRFQPGEKH